jgi:hypothetical protein
MEIVHPISQWVSYVANAYIPIVTNSIFKQPYWHMCLHHFLLFVAPSQKQQFFNSNNDGSLDLI